MRPSLAGSLLLGMVLILAGCAGQVTRAPSAGASVAPVVSMPACAAASLPAAATLPAAFPATIPMPPGSLVTGTRSDGKQLIVDAILPGTLPQAAGFMTRELPAAGWAITDSDAEQDEAEASFSGAGFTGRFRLHSITGCNDAVTFSLTVTPS